MGNQGKIIAAPSMGGPYVLWYADAEGGALAVGAPSAEGIGDAPRAASLPIDDEQHRRERESAREAAYQQGLAEGKALGEKEAEESARRAARQEVEDSLTALAGLMDQFRQERTRLLGEAEEEAVTLSLAVARKIVDNELMTPRVVVEKVVDAAMKRVRGSKVLHLKVNPADSQEIDLKRLAEQVELAEGFKIVDDPGIKRGGCVIETSCGRVDATVSSQLQEIEKLFREQLRGSTQHERAGDETDEVS